jgi:hypothetical protein
MLKHLPKAQIVIACYNRSLLATEQSNLLPQPLNQCTLVNRATANSDPFLSTTSPATSCNSEALKSDSADWEPDSGFPKAETRHNGWIQFLSGHH